MITIFIGKKFIKGLLNRQYTVSNLNKSEARTNLSFCNAAVKKERNGLEVSMDKKRVRVKALNFTLHCIAR